MTLTYKNRRIHEAHFRLQNWVDVGAAVAIFGEKAGNRFRRMVGTDHNSLVIPAMLYWAFIRSGLFHFRERSRSVRCLLRAAPVRWPAPQL